MAVIYGGKDVENRSLDAPRQFKAAVGRRVFVHASKTMTQNTRTPSSSCARSASPARTRTNCGSGASKPDALMGASGLGGKVGIVGYCFGGTIASPAAARLPGLSAAVAITAGGSSDEGHEAARSDP